MLEYSTVKPLKPVINDVRAFKSEAEIANMRKVGQISGRVFTEAMKQTWTREKDLGAFLDYSFLRRGCDGSAYVSVVAGDQVWQQIPILFSIRVTSKERRNHSLCAKRRYTKVNQGPVLQRL